MFRGAWQIFRIGRIPIRIHWSLVLILPYLAVIIGAQFNQAARLAGVAPGHFSIGPYAWGLALAVALFVCVLLHELSHIAVGLRAGAEVHDVTLMMLGGVTNMTKMPRGALGEGLMAVAGPVSSGVLAAIFLLGYRAIPPAAHDLRFGIFYLGEINLVLAIFNLVPAFPMDGGRVLRSALQPALGRTRSTRAAAVVGRAIAIVLGILGIYGGNFILMLIAVFIFLGAGAEARQVETDDLVRRFRVGQVMDRHPPQLDPASTVGEAAARALAGAPELFVVDSEGGLLGAVTAETVLSPGLEPGKPVADLMTSPGPLVKPDDPLDEALRKLAESPLPRLAVVENGRLVGSLGANVVAALWRGRGFERQAATLRRREA